MFKPSIPRAFVLVPLLAGIAACGDGGTGPELLQPEQIAGDYRVCELTFTPSGTVPAPADILAAMDTTAGLPRLEIGGTSQRPFSFLYRRAGGGTTQSISGTYSTGPRDVQLNIGSGTSARQLLLPERLFLDFDEAARAFEVSEFQQTHSVARADYEALTGRQEPNINPTIVGRLTGRFVAWGTPCR